MKIQKHNYHLKLFVLLNNMVLHHPKHIWFQISLGENGTILHTTRDRLRNDKVYADTGCYEVPPPEAGMML